MSRLEATTSTTDHEPIQVDNQNVERPVKSTVTPLPKLQVFIVYLIQFSEPVTATVIYPFINQFVRETGVTKGDERKTGYFAGVIESAFFITEALTVFHWGRASDRFGRRPVLLLGPLGLAFAMISFGLSTHFWPLVISRCLQGIFNGNIGVSKTILAEISDPSNIADVYALIPLMWVCGVTIGPVLGGVLSRPADNWPETFGKIAFFYRHPYFLPCAAAALIALMSGLIASVGLKETLPSAIARRTAKLKRKAAAKATSSHSSPVMTLLADEHGTNYGSTDIDPSHGRDLNATTQFDFSDIPESPPPFHVLLTPRVITTMLSYAFLAFTDMCCAVLLPLVYSTSISLGGLGLDPYRIGVIMSALGVLNSLVQVIFFGPIIRKLGARNTFIIAQIAFIVIIGLYPLLSFSTQRAGRVNFNASAVLSVQLIFQTWIGIAYGAALILIADSTPSKASLGAINGMGQAIASSMRSIAPSFASSLFSLSLQKKLAGGNMVYFVLLGITVIGIRISVFLPQSPRSESQ